ncbi:Co-activator of prophage gene expression IbrB [Klebsiella pneumoniae]|nr:Co-activator of prophage gene expression IbrB [Klebsiella pneumoniae]
MPQVINLTNRAEALFTELDSLPLAKRVEAINQIRLRLHEHSPFADEPVDCVQWVRGEQVEANDYNPNSVATPEMKLLELSIDADGFTQPIVTHREQEEKPCRGRWFPPSEDRQEAGADQETIARLPAGGFDQKRARGNGRPDRRHHPSQPRSRCLFRAADDRHRGQASADRMD